MYPQHDKDLYGWAIHTVQLLRSGEMETVDFDNIIDELENMARNDEYELINRLSLIISHLLKWQFQPHMRSHRWLYTIREQRKQVKIHLRKNPSLKSQLNDILLDAYEVAISKAAKETSLNEKDFPVECPYTSEEITDNDFGPDAQVCSWSVS